MENQHRKISGYRDLNEAEIALMNKIKAMGPQLHELLEEVTDHILSQQRRAVNPSLDANSSEMRRLEDATPERWTHIAGTHLQQGLMALTRAVAQPTFF